MARVAGGGGRGRVDHCFMALLKSGRLALLASDKYHSLCSVDPPRSDSFPPPPLSDASSLTECVASSLFPPRRAAGLHSAGRRQQPRCYRYC